MFAEGGMFVPSGGCGLGVTIDPLRLERARAEFRGHAGNEETLSELDYSGLAEQNRSD
jgi:hypothetical protein